MLRSGPHNARLGLVILDNILRIESFEDSLKHYLSMTIQTLLARKPIITFVVALLVGLHILWEYTHGGVAVHYPLADDSLPGISNWWGLLTVPLLTWVALTLLQRRVNKQDPPSEDEKGILRGLAGAFLFGMIAALLWETGAAHILQYFILLPLVLSLLITVHRAEHLWGFVLGMAYTFGGVLPIAIGLVLLVLSFIINRGVRGGVLWLLAKLRSAPSN